MRSTHAAGLAGSSVARPAPVSPSHVDPDAPHRLLRRADWRFLLPEPRPAHARCFAGGTLAQAAGIVSQSLDDGAEFAPGVCDLAVAVDPDDAMLHKAFAALRPGGALYAEWRARPGRGVGAIRRRLQRAGFGRAALYWPRPDPEKATAAVWLPLDDPEALQFNLENRPPARGWLRRVARAVRRRLLLPRPFFKIPNPVVSVARRPISGEGREGPAGLLKEVGENWAGWGLGTGTPDRLSMLLVTSGRRASGKAVALIFERGRPSPAAAVKIARTPEFSEALRREAGILRDLHEGGAALHSTPRVLASGDGPLGFRIVETAFAGLPAFVLVHHGNFREIALAAVGWLVGLAGRPNPAPRSQWWPRLVKPLLDDFDSRFGSVVGAEAREEGRRLLETLGPLPLVWEQRDFSPWNVLMDRRENVFVVDWESAEPGGLPLRDLVYFLAYLGFSVDKAKKKGRFLESYSALSDPATPTGRIARECVDRYCADVGIGAANQRPLRVLTWLLHAQSEYRELEADAGGPPSRQALEASLFLRLWREELKARAPRAVSR